MSFVRRRTFQAVRGSSRLALFPTRVLPCQAPFQGQCAHYHHDLKSFLQYSQHNKLSEESTTYIGTFYEYRCQDALACLGFQLKRSGGRSDAGIDLYGTWNVPSHPKPLQTIVQCKALAAKVGPSMVRELEGAFAGAPAGWTGDDAIGVLCARREASKGVRDAVRRSPRPLIWVLVDDQAPGLKSPQAHARIRQIIWNTRVADIAAEGLGVEIVYDAPRGDYDYLQKEVRLTWNGRLWQPPEEATVPRGDQR